MKKLTCGLLVLLCCSVANCWGPILGYNTDHLMAKVNAENDTALPFAGSGHSGAPSTIQFIQASNINLHLALPNGSTEWNNLSTFHSDFSGCVVGGYKSHIFINPETYAYDADGDNPFYPDYIAQLKLFTAKNGTSPTTDWYGGPRIPFTDLQGSPNTTGSPYPWTDTSYYSYYLERVCKLRFEPC